MKNYISIHHLYIKIFFHRLNKCFNNFIPKNFIQNTLNEEVVDSIIEQIVNDENFEKSEIEIEKYKSIEELNYH